jgi:hypothetical protein
MKIHPTKSPIRKFEILFKAIHNSGRIHVLFLQGIGSEDSHGIHAHASRSIEIKAEF